MFYPVARITLPGCHARSPWDLLHPRRQFARKLVDGPVTSEFLLNGHVALEQEVRVEAAVFEKCSTKDIDHDGIQRRRSALSR